MVGVRRKVSCASFKSDMSAPSVVWTKEDDERSLWDHTSIPGLTHAKQRSGESKTRRNVWVFLFVVGLCLTLYQVQKVLMEYFKYPVVTKVS